MTCTGWKNNPARKKNSHRVAHGHPDGRMQRAPAAQQQQDGDEKLAVEFQQRQKQRRQPRRAQPDLEMILHQIRGTCPR